MRILLVDDHSLIRSGIRDSLNNHYDRAAIAEADSGKAALTLLRKKAFDLALVDLFLPGEKLFMLLRQCGKERPDLPVIVLSSSDQASHIRKCIDLGAVGFVAKSSSQAELFEAIDIVMAGGTCFPSPAASAQGDPVAAAASVDPLTLDYGTVSGILTKRQMEILVLMARGRPNKEIARSLGLSVETVKVHVRAIFKGLGLSNRSQAAILGEKLGLTPQTSDN